jgi:hypothetical protein
VAVRFTYLVQNPDGSTSTKGADADRAPTWGELSEHVASTGATLLPATPAAQPPSASREEAPPPAAAPPREATPPPLPSEVEKTSGTAPTPVNPPRALGSYVLPAGSAALGAWGLPAAVTAAMGPVGWLPAAGLAVLGAGYGGFGGEYGQAQLERKMYGEPPPGSPTPFARAKEFATTAAETEAAVQTVSPLVMPAVRAVARPFGSAAVRSSSEAGPLLRTGALGGAGGATERTAVEGGQEVASDLVRQVEQGHARQSIQVATSAPTVPVNTDALPPLVGSTRQALAAQGGTPEQLALFDRNMAPLTQGGPQPLHAVLSAERNLNRWQSAMPGNLVLPELDALATTTRNTIGTAVEGTPAAQPWNLYTQTQAVSAPTRAALHESTVRAGEAFQPFLAGSDGQLALKAIIEHGAPEDVAKVGQAWLASTRQAARTSADPVKYMADAYEALPVHWRTAMFGEQTPALGQVIGAASGAAPPGLRVPVVGTVQVARPWARSVLMSPRAAAATNVLGKTATGAGRGVLYTGVEQAREERPPAGP